VWRQMDGRQRLASIDSVLLDRAVMRSLWSTTVTRWRRPLVEAALLVRRQRAIHHRVSTHGRIELNVTEAWWNGASAMTGRLKAKVTHHG